MAPILSEFLLDKSIGILIVEPTTAIAGSIRRVILEKGYSNIFIAHSVLDAFNTLGNNNIGWVFCSPLLEEKLNQWHCLRLPLEVQAYENLMVSVLVSPDQTSQFENYYAFGAFSIHSRQLTYNSFNEEFDTLLSRLSENRTLAGVIAVDVRNRLISLGQTQKLESFEESYTKKFGASPKQLLKLIESRLRNNSNLEAMLEIRNAFAAHPELGPDLKALSQTYLQTGDIQAFRHQFPFRSILILDPDASQQQFLKTAVTAMGAELVTCCDTHESACEALHQGQVYDVIFTEWKLNKAEGHAFIQHVRQHGHETQPVILYTGLVKPEDLPLVEELRGVFIISKPCPMKSFKKTLEEALDRWNFPQEAIDQEDKIVNAALSGKHNQALMLNRDFQANKKIEPRRRDYVKAVIAFSEEHFEEAKEIILASVRQGVPKHKEISLLGKILLRLGDPGTALKFLEQANQMVPGNIERLCDVADASAEVGKGERALQAATEAYKLGGDISMVQSVYAKHAVANGMFEEASDHLESEATAREMIAFMNNIGIAHAVASKWDASEISYRNALTALKGRHPKLSALVCYNFGLSLVRQNRLKDAVALLRLAESKGEPAIKRKAADLSQRVAKAILSNQPFVLKEAIREVTSSFLVAGSSPMESYGERSKVEVHGLFRVLVAPCDAPGMDLATELPKNVTSRDKDRLTGS